MDQIPRGLADLIGRSRGVGIIEDSCSGSDGRERSVESAEAMGSSQDVVASGDDGAATDSAVDLKADDPGELASGGGGSSDNLGLGLNLRNAEEGADGNDKDDDGAHF